MINNSLSKHIESGDIYDNFSTNENFYSFLLAQQDESLHRTDRKTEIMLEIEKNTESADEVISPYL